MGEVKGQGRLVDLDSVEGHDGNHQRSIEYSSTAVLTRILLSLGSVISEVKVTKLTLIPDLGTVMKLQS